MKKLTHQSEEFIQLDRLEYIFRFHKNANLTGWNIFSGFTKMPLNPFWMNVPRDLEGTIFCFSVTSLIVFLYLSVLLSKTCKLCAVNKQFKKNLKNKPKKNLKKSEKSEWFLIV